MSHTDMKIQNFEKGVSLYLALMITAVLLAIGLGISTIIISQMKMIRGMEYSVIALHAADTGIERALYGLYKEGATFPFAYSGCIDLNGNAFCDPEEPTYSVDGIAPGPNCTASNYCLKSVGTYKETRRAIEANG